MSTEEMRWLLQRIGDPETARRFVEAQYKRGRISVQVIADLAQEQGGADFAAAGALTAKSAA
jgi:hypothetical protein